jgi:hypothetical protein
MTLVGIGWGGVDWICLAQDRGNSIALVSAVMNLRFLVLGNYRMVTQLAEARAVLSSIETTSQYA